MIHPDRDEWALDNFGDALCHDCHLQALAVFHAQGVVWDGQTFGYEIGAIRDFGLPFNRAFDPPCEMSDCSSEKVGRNEPCPCGSGKKFKKCCGQ
ncbi:MAG TPA: SEC-C metal-binding domain-containing protein [Verrucomicrobiae bacterium]|nr:SEC-C metal-binding domain-containing protein [Verrucomicrobiae bacterium]